MDYMTLEEAKAAVEAALLMRARKDHAWDSCKIVMWGCRDDIIGVRVAEVSLHQKRTAGLVIQSVHQGETDGLVVCAAAERAIVSRMMRTGYDDSEQGFEIEDADTILHEAMFGPAR